MAFDELENHDSTPTFPLTDVQKVRFGEAAQKLEQARTQGYVEASVLAELLELAQMVVPLITKGL